jgi:hypothetical protein
MSVRIDSHQSTYSASDGDGQKAGINNPSKHHDRFDVKNPVNSEM